VTDTSDERDAVHRAAPGAPTHPSSPVDAPRPSGHPTPPRIGCAVVRLDLGAFVLGALDEGEAQQVRGHVAACPRCRAEYDDLAGLPGFLARLTEVEAQASGIATGGTAPARLLAGAAARSARRRQVRIGLAAAAAVLVVAAGAVGWSVGDSSDDGDRAGAPVPGGTVVPIPPPTATFDPAAGRTARASDPQSGVGAEVRYAASEWGSDVDLTVSGIRPGTRCRLDVYGSRGRVETASSWVVPPAGYPAGDPLHGTTGIPVGEITGFSVKTVVDGGQLLEIQPGKP
jgi:hypothetical protein